MSRLAGKTALITGGTTGIGLATAQLFENEGARVAITGRNPERLHEAKAQLSDKALAIQADTANLEEIEASYQELRHSFEGLDILVVNAGIAKFAPIDQVSEELYDQIFNINLKGAYFTIQKALPLLRKGASVVLTTSVVNEMGLAGSSVYSATKAGLRNLARTLSADLVERGIRVNAIAPGPIQTPIYAKLEMPAEDLQQTAEAFVSQIPLGRFGESEEVANSILFLASDESSFIVGAEIAVDGGMSQI